METTDFKEWDSFGKIENYENLEEYFENLHTNFKKDEKTKYYSHYTSLSNIENIIGEWAFSFPCDIIAGKISVSTLLKSVGIELRDEYEGDRGGVEKILDYMELVREFDRNKLFITVNMRSFFDDEIIAEFMKTVISHEYRVLMLESQAYPKLAFEKRVTIDADLCEF